MTARLQLTPQEQQELLGDLTSLLAEALPSDWRQLMIDYRQVGNHIDIATGIRQPDNSLKVWDPPQDTWLYFQKLRHGMYETDRGTWFSMRLTIEPPADFQVKYNYQNLPNWGTPTVENFAIDLERYPRSNDNKPDWFLSNLPSDSK